jgi:hypothetical protein
MEIIDSLVFFLSVFARYARNLLDSCSYVAGEISDIRYERNVEQALKPEWANPAWIGALGVSIACVAYVAYVGGTIQLLGALITFASGYWVFGRVRLLVPQFDSSYFVRTLHRRLKDRSNAEPDSELKRSTSNLVDRIEAQLANKLR